MSKMGHIRTEVLIYFYAMAYDIYQFPMEKKLTSIWKRL